MSKPNKKNQSQEQRPLAASPAIKSVIELTDTALSQVTGGLNPQPLPPRDPGNELIWR